MTDRDTTLQWLVSQARDHEGVGPFAIHSPEVTKAKAAEGLATPGVCLSEELAWDLATGAASEWLDPPFPEFKGMDSFEQVNLLQIAGELGFVCRLNNWPWLALASQNLFQRAENGLGESDLPLLIKRLGLHTCLPSPISNVHEALSHLNSMINSMDNDCRGCASVLAAASVESWIHYPSALPAAPIGPLEWSAMIEWVKGRTNEAMDDPTVSEILMLVAYRSSCTCILVDAYHELRQGRIAPPDLLSWYDSKVDTIRLPQVTVPAIVCGKKIVNSSQRFSLAVICAQWLLDSGTPKDVISHLDKALNDWAGEDEPELFGREVAITRAFANARLGFVSSALREIEPHFTNLVAGNYWPVGRLLCEAGDKRGPGFLQYAVALPPAIEFSSARARMCLLFAEREVEVGDPAEAARLAEAMADCEQRWISTHAKVIAAEAYLALSRENPGQREEHLVRANAFLKRLSPETMNDTPDRLKPRALAAKGELFVLDGDFPSARNPFREAMRELENAPPVAWGTDGPYSQISPDGSPGAYHRRPWARNWSNVARLGLLAELSGNEDEASAFVLLQRYRTTTHTGTIAELAGFTQESALSAMQMEERQELLHEFMRLKALENSLMSRLDADLSSIDEASGAASESMRGFGELECSDEHKECSLDRLAEIRVDIEDVESEIRELDQQAIGTRGYLSRTTGIRRPGIEEIKRYLSEADAAVIEIVRLDGTRWGRSIRWIAFAVTPDKGVERIELSAREIERELRQLRSSTMKFGNDSFGKLSDLIIGKLPRRVFRYRHLFIAADGDAWAVPFRSLVRRRWWFVPWKLTDPATYSGWPIPEFAKKFMDSLATRMDSGVVTNVISTSHLVRLLQRSSIRAEHEDSGVVVGSSGNSGERILCQGLATSLEAHPAREPGDLQWKRYPGSLQQCTQPGGDRPEWLDGSSQVFMGSWHTTFSGDRTTVATFHFDDGEMTLAEFLSQSRHKSKIAVILSCNMSLPDDATGHGPNKDDRVFSRIGSAGFGIAEALQAEAIVATTSEVTAEVAFVLGRFLAAELTAGADVHTALAASQKRLRECTVGDVVNLLEELEQEVPEVVNLLNQLRNANPNHRAFPDPADTEPFYILGLPTARLRNNLETRHYP